MFFPNRFHLLGLTSLLFLATLGVVSAQNISVKLDGRVLQFDQPPARVGGRMMVPLRGIFEALKADVVYDGATRSIQATKDSRVIQLQLGSRTAIIDGRTLFLDVPADTIGGRTMVPLRFVAEALGAEVKWDGPTKTVLMSSGSGGNTAVTPPVTPPTTPPVSKDGPRIDRVFHSATTDLVAGSSIDIVVYGEPGGKATFEILGSTKQIALPEVSSGKYQSRWTIPNGLSVERGVLLAHLAKNGRETAVEATRQVTVKTNTGTTQNPQASTWQESPASGGTTAAVRPQVSLMFPSAIQANTVRFFVDGVDFSNQVRMAGRQFAWQPTYNLSAANHTAEIQAVSTQGQRLSHTWTFRIDPNSANNNSGSQNFQVSEVRPATGTTVAVRPQIGALFNQSLRSINFYVDGTLISQQAGVQRLSNGMLWTPNYNLSTGQHRATVKAVNQNGQVLNRDWNFVVGVNEISNFNVSPIKVSAGQQVKVSLNAPTGSTGSFSVGQIQNLTLREMSSGRYEGVYTASTRDTGTAAVNASVRLPNGQVLQKTAASRVTFEAAASQFTVSNLRNGMTISPVFNVQGLGEAGRTVSVVVTYNSANIIGAIAGQTKTLRTQGVVRGNGSYDVPVDASVIPAGQQFRLTVSDGQKQSQMVLTRR